MLCNLLQNLANIKFMSVENPNITAFLTKSYKNTHKLLMIFYHIITHTIKEVILFMNDKKKQDTKKTATDNKWISTGQARPTDKSERRDGPGGEDAD